MAKTDATAGRTRRTRGLDPKVKKEGGHQEGRFSIQTGQTDRKTKARQKAGQVAVQKQRPRPKGGVKRAGGKSKGKGVSRRPVKNKRPGKQSKDLGDIRGSRPPGGNRGNRRNTPTRKALKRKRSK